MYGRRYFSLRYPAWASEHTGEIVSLVEKSCWEKQALAKGAPSARNRPLTVALNVLHCSGDTALIDMCWILLLEKEEDEDGSEVVGTRPWVVSTLLRTLSLMFTADDDGAEGRLLDVTLKKAWRNTGKRGELTILSLQQTI